MIASGATVAVDVQSLGKVIGLVTYGTLRIFWVDPTGKERPLFFIHNFGAPRWTGELQGVLPSSVVEAAERITEAHLEGAPDVEPSIPGVY